MMRVCASLGSAGDAGSDDLAKADLVEIRTDIFASVPKNILRRGQTGLISFKNGIRTSMVPDRNWIVDIGGADRPDMPNTIVSSYHDFGGAPDAGTIAEILGRMKGDIAKGAFTVNSLKDAAVLFDASVLVKKKHIIIGMGELGRITRIRSELLGNEFAFAYVGRETAPGQLSVSEMAKIGGGTAVTGIIGSGIGYTRSPAMHDAAFSHSGIDGKYLVFDTPSLDRFEDFVVNYGIRGVNVTKPHKTAVMDRIGSCDPVSEAVGAVNAVVNANGELKGYNTDVYGIEKAMERNSVDVRGKRALIMGSGGAARSCAYFLSENGCDATVTGRNAVTVRRVASDLGLTARERTSVSINMYDIVINCIPLNTDNDISEYPVKISAIDKSQTVFDMVYGKTHLNDVARKKGCAVVPGEDMLAFQGIRSFELFTSKTIPYEVMRSAI